jgi:hypothetical protein
MASTYSSNFKLEKMATGANANTWGTNTNNNLDVLDAFGAGYLSKSVAGSANITLSTANADPAAESSNKTIELTGALTGDIVVFIPATESQYTFFNNTTGSQTLTIAATGHTANGVVITQGAKTSVYCDGASNYNVEISGSTDAATGLGTGTVASARISGAYTGITGLGTLTTALTTTANINLGDNDVLNFGASNDLQIYHTGSLSLIDDQGTGGLFIRGDAGVYIRSTTDENKAIFTSDGSVELYYDNVKKLETTSGGIAVTGAITATGDITAFFTSDETLKTNIENIENPMEKIAQLNGVSYNWTDEAQAKYDHLNGDKEIGVIAQQVEKVLPEMVGTRDDGTKAVRYERMCALLIECVKDLQSQVNDLKKGH